MTIPDVGVVIVTHGPAGADMLTTLARLVGATAVQGFIAVEVNLGDDKRAIAERLTAAVANVNTGAGVLVACDLHGSTPANCAVEIMRGLPDVAVISGVNLAMLIKLSSAHRNTTPAGLAQAAVDTAIRSTRIEGGSS